jgi:hypothetical protein
MQTGLTDGRLAGCEPALQKAGIRPAASHPPFLSSRLGVGDVVRVARTRAVEAKGEARRKICATQISLSL